MLHADRITPTWPLHPRPSLFMNQASAASANAPKPIRFVTNHDGPYAKRRRINSACLTCRRKKTRCSGERPFCGTCTQNKHDCAGYGDDNATSNANRDAKKAVRRGSQHQQVSNTQANDTGSAPSRKVEQPIDPQLTRPHLPPHTISAASHISDSSLPNRSPKREEEVGSISSAGLRLSTRNRMPYFRYFGPTAIVPGLRQMVVKVRGKQHGSAQTTSDRTSTRALVDFTTITCIAPGLTLVEHALDSSPAQASNASPPAPEARTPLEIPVYDASAMSPSPLITHLCKLFFVHLGCSFPFLQRDRFMRDLEEKQVDAILVDAVCALAARFSTHHMLVGNGDHPSSDSNDATKIQPSEYGQAFAHRAKSAIPDAFPCPSVAVVQAALLLAYDEFGASRDSGLWMYLGIAIRMAQDLGMQTLQGLKYEGRNGPTPNSIKNDPQGLLSNPEQVQHLASDKSAEEQEQRAVERERLDTFWSIFFLDRVISSGTGRPVTLRDRDIEISFPSLDEVDVASGWPSPYPALIRIIHLYGRVTDLLNRIRNATDITTDLQKQLGALEDRLTLIYQNLSPKLHFNAVNFQQYVKIKQGTNFLLLHCWFHTLIVLLHQPTLLKTLEGTPQSLSSNSRELSMSSAKTVADILAFTELIDAKSGLGNPFTSQPIYIAACAFLKETAMHSASSQPQSRPSSPGRHGEQERKQSTNNSLDRFGPINDHEQKQAAKHTLLASAANQNYQRCYRALKALETYWAGVKYILTVLDQKAKGVGDPLLYTREEMESALEAPRPEPSFTSPGWRRKLSWGTYLTAESSDSEMAKVAAAMRKGTRTPTISGSPSVHPSQAIGWSLTGTMNSPSTNVAVMYTSENNDGRATKASPSKPLPASTQPSIVSLISDPPIKFEPNPSMPSPSTFGNFDPSSMPPPPSSLPFNGVSAPDPVLVSDADLLLNLHSPFTAGSPTHTRNPLHGASPYTRAPSLTNNHHTHPHHPHNDFSPTFGTFSTPSDNTFGDMVIDTQDVDMSVLGADMMPWDLEYLPHDMLYFGDGGFGASGFAADGASGDHTGA